MSSPRAAGMNFTASVHCFIATRLSIRRTPWIRRVTEPPHLRRFDYSLAGGGPIWKDKIFFFGSAERITGGSGRRFRLSAPPCRRSTNLLRAQEDPFDAPTRDRETRAFLKLNQNFGRHQLVQEMNYTNENTKGSGSGLPSTRSNSGARYLMLGFGGYDAAWRSG